MNAQALSDDEYLSQWLIPPYIDGNNFATAEASSNSFPTHISRQRREFHGHTTYPALATHWDEPPHPSIYYGGREHRNAGASQSSSVLMTQAPRQTPAVNHGIYPTWGSVGAWAAPPKVPYLEGAEGALWYIVPHTQHTNTTPIQAIERNVLPTQSRAGMKERVPCGELAAYTASRETLPPNHTESAEWYIASPISATNVPSSVQSVEQNELQTPPPAPQVHVWRDPLPFVEYSRWPTTAPDRPNVSTMTSGRKVDRENRRLVNDTTPSGQSKPTTRRSAAYDGTIRSPSANGEGNTNDMRQMVSQMPPDYMVSRARGSEAAPAVRGAAPARKPRKRGRRATETGIYLPCGAMEYKFVPWDGTEL